MLIACRLLPSVIMARHVAWGEAMSNSSAAEGPTYHGHRQRLKERFRANGADGFPDYEFLELMLFRVIPRRDTKPLAKRLIAAFGSFGDVLTADTDALAGIPGVGPEIIRDFELIRKVAAKLPEIHPAKRPLLNSSGAILTYCRNHPLNIHARLLRILLLDRRNRLIVDEQLELSLAGLGALPPSVVVKRALAYGAAAIVLVQHSDNECPVAGEVDIRFTKELIATAELLEITLHDYLLLGTEDHISVRGSGLA